MNEKIEGPVTVAGSIIVDRINEINAYPECGELTKITGFGRNVGGCVPNVSIDLKRIDAQTEVRAIGRIGDDADGKFAADTMSEAGVDVSSLVTDRDCATSFTEVMSVPGGQRTFFAYPGACDRFCFEDIDFESFCGGLLHLGYFLLLDRIDHGDGLRILREAKKRGVYTSIDLVSENSDRYSLVKACLPYTDYLIINEYEAGRLTGIEPENSALGEIAKRLISMGVCKKVIIHKPELSVCLSSGVLTAVSSYDIDISMIKGTTGAGDAFCAGALTGIRRGWSDHGILEFASACAAAALRSPDATGGLASEDEIRKYCGRFVRKKTEDI